MLTYMADEKLLALFRRDKHINGYIGHLVVCEMEYFVQTIA